MSGFGTGHARPTIAPNVGRVTAIGTVLVTINVLLMLALSYTPVADLGLLVFSNYFVGIGVFVVTVGGGYWLASTGIEQGSLGLAGAGVALTQAGYGLFGSAVLSVAPSALRIPALGITAVATGAITAVVAVAVFKTDHSFRRWQYYSMGCFAVGFVVGAVGVFVTPLLLLVASALFFLGFVTDLAYEIWAVRENRYEGDLRNAIGIYVAVMGVFVHVLVWVLRILSLLDR